MVAHVQPNPAPAQIKLYALARQLQDSSSQQAMDRNWLTAQGFITSTVKEPNLWHLV